MMDRDEYNRLDWIQDVPRNCTTCKYMRFCDRFAPDHACRKWRLNPHYTGDWDDAHGK